MTTIVILTSEYPYGNKETYIGPELEYINRKKKVYVLPMGTKDTEVEHRPLPDCVELVMPVKQKISKRNLFLKTILAKELFDGLIELVKHKRLNFRTIKELFKFVYAARKHYQTVYQTFLQNGLKDFESMIIYSYWMDSLALVASRFKKLGCRVVCRAHGGDLYDERTPWNHQFLRKYLVEHLDYVFPVSFQGKKYLEDRIGLYENIVPMHLGIVDRGVGEYENRDVITIVSCSNAIKLKRIELIIDALAELDEEVFWYHFGAGEELEKLKKLAESKLSPESYEFKGSVPNEMINWFYKHNSVTMFVNVSETEGVPVSIMEALSYGIPVIATDVGGVRELIEDQSNGYLLDKSFEVDEMMSLIRKIIHMSEEDYIQLRRSARLSYLKSWDSKGNYSKFYNTIINKS